MKHRRKISIKWVVFGAILLFTVIMLLVLWIFQIANLNTFYQNAKRSELESVAKLATKLYKSGELEEAVDQLAEDYDVTIRVMDEEANCIIGGDTGKNEFKLLFTKELFERIRSEAKKNGGVKIYEIEGELFETWHHDSKLEGNTPLTLEESPEVDALEGDKTGEVPSKEESPREDIENKPNAYNPRRALGDMKTVVYCRNVKNEDGRKELLIIASVITPIDATVYTLRRQFVYISVIFVLVAIGVGVGISLLVSRPIVKINKTAKELAKGDFDTKFAGVGYREVEELTDTLNYAASELGRTEELRRDLIANISHDLRTPLTMITAYSEVMRDLPGEMTSENAQVIIDETKRLTTLVNDMLDLSKLQSGTTSLELTEYEFTKTVVAVMNRFSMLKERDGYDIRFEYRDEVCVRADEYKIYQVIYNLIINAINYAGEDKQVIVRQIVNGDIVRMEIEDHGRGIAPEELNNIWDRYYKIDKTHKRAVQGTGLGLAIVQQILKLHDAKYGVRSLVGKGSTFWFELHKI